ncbi:MAG: hypothetical protein ACT4P7_13090 [Gemmatimonadaceae bacterium]
MSLLRLQAPRRAIVLLGATALLGGCRNTIPPWGPTPVEARRNADNAFNAFGFRFTNVQRDPKFATARARMGRYALTPARLFRDSTIWTVHNAPDSSQALYVDATFENGRYFFASRASAPYPRRLGDERHYLRLRKINADDYEWITIVDHGVGPVTATQAASALGMFVTSFEGRREGELLADVRTTFRRTARHLGQLFRIDSARTTALADGSTALVLGVSFHPDTLRRNYPAFAAYVDKYVMPSRYRMQLADGAGSRYMDVSGRDGAFVIRLRSRNGHLAALSGTPRPMPDSLQLRMDFSAKFKIFRVGFRNLIGDFAIERGDRDRAFMMRFRREPDWQLPLAIGHLIRTPLRKPFEGRGSELRLSVRDDLGSQTMSLRHVRTVVNESAIMRWLGNLGGTAFGDFEGQSEIEENRFLAGMFEALRRDVADTGT